MEFEKIFAQRPQVIVCNVKFLSSKKVAQGFVAIPKLLGLLFQVRDVILNLSLSTSRRPPIVCIDESQVTFGNLDPVKCFLPNFEKCGTVWDVMHIGMLFVLMWRIS